MKKTAVIIMIGAIPLIALAFWPMYFSKPFSQTDGYTHFHATAGALWVATLVIQPILIQYHRYSLHRLVGRASHLLAPAFVIASLFLSHFRLISMDESTFAVEGFTHYLPLYASTVFAVAYLLGIVYRRIPDVHGRFMLLTAAPMVDPVLGRVMAFYLPALPNLMAYQAVTFGLATIIAALLVFSYRTRSPARAALIAYFIFYLIMEIGWFTVATTSTWLTFVAWFRSL